jgi:hypothetical protein
METASPAQSVRPVADERPSAVGAVAQAPEHVGPVAPDRATIKRARDAEIAVPDLCEPPTPYVFSTPDGGALRLERCSAAADGPPEPLSAPRLGPELVAAVQQALKRLGHDPGPVDGLMGPRTRDAIEAFQQAENLTATGEITFSLLDRLQQE